MLNGLPRLCGEHVTPRRIRVGLSRTTTTVGSTLNKCRFDAQELQVRASTTVGSTPNKCRFVSSGETWGCRAGSPSKSEEPRVGKEWVSTCRSRWWQNIK